MARVSVASAIFAREMMTLYLRAREVAADAAGLLVVGRRSLTCKDAPAEATFALLCPQLTPSVTV